MQVLNFFCLNLFKGTKYSSNQIWCPKRFKVMESLRINARAFIKFFKFLEAIYSREVFNRRGHLLEVRTKFLEHSGWELNWCFTIAHDKPNLNWKEHYHLKEQIERWILNTISGAGVELVLPKLTHKKNISGSAKNCWLL